jgi:hypothetical protein
VISIDLCISFFDLGGYFDNVAKLLSTCCADQNAVIIGSDYKWNDGGFVTFYPLICLHHKIATIIIIILIIRATAMSSPLAIIAN